MLFIFETAKQYSRTVFIGGSSKIEVFCYTGIVQPAYFCCKVISFHPRPLLLPPERYRFCSYSTHSLQPKSSLEQNNRQIVGLQYHLSEFCDRTGVCLFTEWKVYKKISHNSFVWLMIFKKSRMNVFMTELTT